MWGIQRHSSLVSALFLDIAAGLVHFSSFIICLCTNPIITTDFFSPLPRPHLPCGLSTWNAWWYILWTFDTCQYRHLCSKALPVLAFSLLLNAASIFSIKLLYSLLGVLFASTCYTDAKQFSSFFIGSCLMGLLRFVLSAPYLRHLLSISYLCANPNLQCVKSSSSGFPIALSLTSLSQRPLSSIFFLHSSCFNTLLWCLTMFFLSFGTLTNSRSMIPLPFHYYLYLPMPPNESRPSVSSFVCLLYRTFLFIYYYSYSSIKVF